MAFWMDVTPTGVVCCAIPLTDHSVHLDGLCLTRRLLGAPCPGCGLTRSFVACAHGDVAESFRYHPMGPFWFLVVVTQIPWRLAACREGFRTARWRHGTARWGGMVVLAGLMLTVVLWLVAVSQLPGTSTPKDGAFFFKR